MASLVIGIDGGASSTTALLAEAETGRILGRGTGGPSNIQAVGETAALRELNAAVAAAFVAAKLPRATVAAAALGLAGIDIDGIDVIRGWSSLVGLAGKVSIANDATLLFAAGTPEGWGLAVIAGTGSIAFTLDRDGKDGPRRRLGLHAGRRGQRVPARAPGSARRVPRRGRSRRADQIASGISGEAGFRGPARFHSGRVSRRVGQGCHRGARADRARTRRRGGWTAPSDLRYGNAGDWRGPSQGRSPTVGCRASVYQLPSPEGWCCTANRTANGCSPICDLRRDSRPGGAGR